MEEIIYAITGIVVLMGLAASFYNIGYAAAKSALEKDKLIPGKKYWVPFIDTVGLLELYKIEQNKDGSTTYIMYIYDKPYINLTCKCDLCNSEKAAENRRLKKYGHL